jgi:hypothetical protein
MSYPVCMIIIYELFCRTIGIKDWNLFNPALTASPSGNMAFVASCAGTLNTGVASIKGAIDGSTGEYWTHKHTFRFIEGLTATVHPWSRFMFLKCNGHSVLLGQCSPTLVCWRRCAHLTTRQETFWVPNGTYMNVNIGPFQDS